MSAPVEYEQTDPRWRSVPYTSTGNKTQTIGTSGCAPTCAAMVVATLRYESIIPPDAAAYSVQHGFRTANNGTAWGFFPAYFDAFKVPCEQTGSVDRAIAALRLGLMVVTAAGKGIWTSGGHLILAYGLSADRKKVMIHDPNSEAAYREIANIDNYRRECTQFWIIREEWNVETKTIFVKDLDRDRMISVDAVNIEGSNFVKLRDIERLAPVVISNEGATPTVRINYKE